MRYRTWNLDIDRFLLPLVPSPPWHLLPYPVAHFLGHRKTTPRETGNLMPIFWAFVGILCSLLVIEAVTIRVPLFEARAVPMIVGSFVRASFHLPRPSGVSTLGPLPVQQASAVQSSPRSQCCPCQ